MRLGLAVVKVGGSLYDLPDLGTRLGRWLTEFGDRRVVLVPGGSATANTVRDWDRAYGLGDERVALRSGFGVPSDDGAQTDSDGSPVVNMADCAEGMTDSMGNSGTGIVDANARKARRNLHGTARFQIVWLGNGLG